LDYCLVYVGSSDRAFGTLTHTGDGWDRTIDKTPKKSTQKNAMTLTHTGDGWDRTIDKTSKKSTQKNAYDL